MKNLYLIFFVFSIGVFSQQKTIGEFTELIVKDGLHVTMVQGDTNAISITSKNEEGITVTNKDGRLKIGMKTFQTLKGIDANIELFFSGDLKMIDVSRGAFLSIIDTLQTQTLEIRSRKGAEVELALLAKMAKYTAKTGGKIIRIGRSGRAANSYIHRRNGRCTSFAIKTKPCDNHIWRIHVRYKRPHAFDLTTRLGGIGRVHGKPLTIVHNKTLGGSLLFQNIGDNDE